MVEKIRWEIWAVLLGTFLLGIKQRSLGIMDCCVSCTQEII